MPWSTKHRGGKLVNVTTSGPHKGRTHGTFPRTQAGHARAAGQIMIMARAEGKKSPWGKSRRKKRTTSPK